VAYVVGKEGPAPSVSELRGFVRERLPEYMVPSAFMALEALPLTPNGKVDRKALPAPETGRLAAEQAAVGPRDPVEEALARIWTEVLETRQIGIHDDFFELGGHSLLAVQVMVRLPEVFGIEMPVTSLFEAPTIAELAVLVIQQQAAGQDAQVIESLLDELNQLSDEEARMLLRKSQG
jgi:acyl carrier protein